MPLTVIFTSSSLEYGATLSEAISDPGKKVCSKYKRCWKAVFGSWSQ